MKSHSASYERFLARRAPLDAVDHKDRAALLKAMETLVGNTLLVSIDGEVLRDVLELRREYGSVVYAKNLSETPGENHYDYCYPWLLYTTEEDKRTAPETTVLLENTSGNAGVSFGWVAREMGYHTVLVVPQNIPAARKERLRESVDELVLPEQKIGFIKDTQVALLRELTERQKSGARVVLPNHSRRHETCEAFSRIGAEVNQQLPDGERLDAAIFGIGNGTTITGIAPVLQQQHPDVTTVGFTDLHNSLIGVTGKTGVQFPFVDKLRLDEGHCLLPKDWTNVLERYNRGRARIDTIGRTSAASLAIAKRMIEQRQKAMHILVLFYDKLDRYANEPITTEAVYRGNGEWE